MTVTTAFRTGSEIDAFCTRCDLELGHTVIAMVAAKVVKVRCDTCGVQHAYRGAQGRPSTGIIVRPRKATPSWEDRMKGRNLGRTRRYDPKEYFQVDDIIAHATFGLGLVTANRSDKIDVAFKPFEKTLVHGRVVAAVVAAGVAAKG